MRNSTPEDPAAAVKRGYELFELDASYIGWFAAGLVVLLVTTALVTFAMMGGVRVQSPPSLQVPRSDVPGGAPVPVLQSAPAGELRAYRLEKAETLQGYRWIDRDAGIVQLPIERAMQLIAERGHPPDIAPGGAR